MKVRDLKLVLETMDDERLVVMSRDAEGNSFSPLDDWSENTYQAESTWAGEIGLEHLTPTLEEEGYTEEDLLLGAKALVLWPTN